METTQTSFERVLDQVARRMKKAQKTLSFLQELTKAKRMDIAFASAFDLAREIEKMTLLARVLPAYTGHPQALAIADDMIQEIVPVNIGYTREGWFAAFLPALLPKKEKGGVNYFRGILYPAMRRFFAGKIPARYPHCVVIFRHVYDRARPERQYRDHDNIELNQIIDIIAMYVMADDSALRCIHHYCSAAGSEDRTEVYVAPQSEFIDWLTAEKSFPDAGIELLENHS